MDESTTARKGVDASGVPVLLDRRFQFLLQLAVVVGLAGLTWDLSRDAANHRSENSLVDPDVAALRIDLNEATVRELMLVPGVGRKTAEQIVLDRRIAGPFHELSDLDRVRGIGEKTIAQFERHCFVRVPRGGPGRAPMRFNR